jgi:hypothetical protein
MPDPPDRIRPATGHHAARSTPRSNVVIGAISASVACAGVLAALGVHLVDPDNPAAPPNVATQEPHRGPQPVSQEGRLIAVSSNSVTAQSANGFTQTYFITPNTTTVTHDSGQPSSATSHFAVNDEVEIVGTVQDGTAVATAVADRDMTGIHGPPMDFIAAQPVSNDAGAPVIAP